MFSKIYYISNKDEYCYTYSLSTNPKNWTDAQRYCEFFNGSLAIPRTQFQFDRIRSLCNEVVDAGCWVSIFK